MSCRKIEGAPGHEAVPEGVIGTKSQAQCPEAARRSIRADGAAFAGTGSLLPRHRFSIFFFKGFAQIFPFSVVAFRAVFRGMGNDRIAGYDDEDCQDPACHEGAAPAIEEGYKYGTKRSSDGITDSRTGIKECRPFAPFFLSQPDRLHLAAGRINRRFRYAQKSPDSDEQRTTGNKARNNLERTPEDARTDDDSARFEFVTEPAAGNLHEHIAPEECAEDDPYHLR